VTVLVGSSLLLSEDTRTALAALDRSTFITAVSAVASILALFCSISFAFVLFISQANKAERLAAFDRLKTRLLGTQ
jgi:hypothetical protein